MIHEIPLSGPWAELNLTALRENIARIQSISGCPVIAVVKANAYGHGVIPIAKAAAEAGCPFLAVARFCEAEEIRNAGIHAPILVLSSIAPEEARICAERNYSVAVYHPEQAAALAQALQSASQPLRVHVKVDMGMNRLGIQLGKDEPDGFQQALTLLRTIANSKQFFMEGLFSHFPRSDEEKAVETELEIDLFERFVQAVRREGLAPQYIHLANSAAALYHPRSCQFDFVRSGIAMLGLDPSDEAPKPLGCQPVLSLKSRITLIKTVDHGQTVGYGGRFISDKDGFRFGVVALGYADGVRRGMGNIVLIHGKRVRVLGTLCMDQCMVDLNDIPNSKIGDEVVFIGKQGDETLSAEMVGARWNTINYEVTCALAHRVPRIVIQDTPENKGQA